MIILRAGMQDSRLRLWGERPAEPPAIAPKRRGRPAALSRRAAPLPCAAEVNELAEALAEVTIAPAHQPAAETALVWLPTIAGRPLASSPLIAELPAASERAHLAPWKVTALAWPTAPAIALLLRRQGDALAGRRHWPGPGLLGAGGALRLTHRITFA